MLGGTTPDNQSANEGSSAGMQVSGSRPIPLAPGGRDDTRSIPGFEAEYGCALPALVNDEREALAGLLHSRLVARGVRTGEFFDFETTRALAERLSRPPSLSYHELLELYGDYRRARAVLESLVRVGLLFDAGNSVILPAAPVTLQTMVESSAGYRRVWRGDSPVLASQGERIRVLASSRVALELRVFRVAHDLSGGVHTRSITRASLVRGRLSTLDFDPFDIHDPHVEQLLLHASWPSPTGEDEQDAEPTCATADPCESVAASMDNERHGLVASAGLGWMVEYMLPRTGT